MLTEAAVMLSQISDLLKFRACSGDRSQQIYKQVQVLGDSMDLVIMTAGGNDLCLVRTFKVFIFPTIAFLHYGCSSIHLGRNYQRVHYVTL
jgi:hypothetical protein